MKIKIKNIIHELKRGFVEETPYLLLPNAVAYIQDPGEKKLYELEHLVNAQSIGFMCDLIPIFQGILRQIQSRINPQHGTRYSILDVGSRTAAGTELLAEVFYGYMSICFDVDAVDLNPAYKGYSDTFNHCIRDYFVQDAFALTREYDFLLSSHTIEHVEHPIEFVQRIAQLSRYGAVFYCPVNEINPIAGHYTITIDQIKAFGAVKIWIIDSWWWRHVHSENGPSKCVAFIVPGKEDIGLGNIQLGYEEIL